MIVLGEADSTALVDCDMPLAPYATHKCSHSRDELNRVSEIWSPRA